MSAIINRLCDHLRQLLDPIVPSHIDVWMAQHGWLNRFTNINLFHRVRPTIYDSCFEPSKKILRIK